MIVTGEGKNKPPLVILIYSEKHIVYSLKAKCYFGTYKILFEKH